MLDHEYALLGGINRSQIGRFLSIFAALVSATLVFLLLSAVDLAQHLGIPVNLPPTALSLLSAGVVFTGLYAVFNKHAWRWRLISAVLKVPDLSGEWNCKGHTLDENGKILHEWNAHIFIVQTWDKIRVRLRTTQSASNSITAALFHDEVDGFRLLYNYRNDPKMGEPTLKSHIGCANILFNKDLSEGKGEYFNGYGRPTFGTMELSRKA